MHAELYKSIRSICLNDQKEVVWNLRKLLMFFLNNTYFTPEL